MATKEWLGDGSANLFNVAGNWTPSGVPGAGDVAVFNDKANNRECYFDLTTGSSITIGEIIVESTYGSSVRLQTVPVTKGVYLAKADGIKAGTASTIDFRQGGSGSEYGSYKSFANRFLMMADGGNWSGTITLNMYGGSVVTKFDDGDHQTTVLKTGSFAPNYVAPTGTSGKTTFTAFTADDGITFQPTGNLVDNDRLKHFDFGTFTYSDDLFNAGAATCEFKATSSGIYLPITGATGYGQSPSTTPSAFVSYMRKVILNADTAGHKILFNDNNYVSLEELEIGDGVMLKGPTGLTAQGADIRLVNAPKIRGSWSFSQISQGVYRSPRHASGPMPKIAGNFNITGKLDVGGLIDPTGLVIDEKGSVAATGHTTVGGKGLLWVKTGSPNELYFTNEDGDDVQITSGSSIAGGGGGGGTVDVVSNVATSRILGRVTGSSGDSEELTQAQVLTFLGNAEAGADVTNEANVKAALNGATTTEVTPAAADKILMLDANDSDNLKNCTFSDFATAAQGSLAASALQAGDPVSALANDLGFLEPPAIANFVPAGGAVSSFANDAGYLTGDATSVYGRWELTSAVDGLAEATDNTLAVDDSSGFTRTGTLTGFSSGTFTATASTAGTYLVYARLHFGDSTTGTSIAETSGNKYTIQIIMYHGSTMEGFGRIQKNGFWVDDHFDCTSIITLADGDTLQIKHKVVDHAASGTKYRIKNGGGNPANAIIMVKLS